MIFSQGTHILKRLAGQEDFARAHFRWLELAGPSHSPALMRCLG